MSPSSRIPVTTSGEIAASRSIFAGSTLFVAKRRKASTTACTSSASARLGSGYGKITPSATTPPNRLFMNDSSAIESEPIATGGEFCRV